MKRKLLLTFLPLALIPLGGAGFLSYKIAKDALTQKAFAHLESIASLQKSRLDNFSNESMERFGLISERILLRIIVDQYLPFPTEKDNRRLTQFLTNIKDTTFDIKNLTIISSKGRGIASTNPILVGHDFSKNELFRRGKRSNSFDVVDLENTQHYGAYFSGPLNQGNHLVGVILIEENVDQLFPWIKNYVGLGETGETFLEKKLPTGEALYLTSLRFDPQSSLKKWVSGPDKLSFHRVLLSEEGPIMNKVDYRGQPIIATTRYITKLGWGLIVKIDQKEAFASIVHLRNLFIFLFLASTLTIIFVAQILAKSIVEPLQRLTRISKEIQEGKPVNPSSIPFSANEIGVLGKALLNMANNLLEAKEGLENEVKKRTQELEQSRIFLNSIFENIPNMIFVKDSKDLKFVSLNKAGETLLGTPREELIGKNDYDFFPTDEADFFTQKDRAVLQTGLLLDIFEEPIHTKKGMRILHTKKIPIYKDGEPEFLLGISEDITQKKEIEKILLQKQAELARTNAEKQNLEVFASVAAHDLQEPLRKIVAFGDLLETEFSNDIKPEGKDYLQRIRNAAKRMSQLITDLLRFSKLTAHDGDVGYVDLNTIIEEVLSDLELRINESGTKITVEKLPSVFANSVLMREIFQNLIGNAIKFRKKNEQQTIKIWSDKLEESEFEIMVKDNGIGIDEKYAGRIFKPFERLHHRSEYEGSGIGLAICHRIVSRLGGKISVASKLGEGAIFTITLPQSLIIKGEPFIETKQTR